MAGVANSIYDFSAKNIEGNKVSLSKYTGNVCIIVNVASKWGKTNVNYSQLVALQEKGPFINYIDRFLRIFDTPSLTKALKSI